jgi:hypothetical protein
LRALGNITVSGVKHYVAVLVAQAEDEWRAFVPDFPGCRAVGATADEALQNSGRNVIAQCAMIDEADLPRPRAVTEIQSDRRWASVRGVDWDKAVLSLVSAGRIGEGKERS